MESELGIRKTPWCVVTRGHSLLYLGYLSIYPSLTDGTEFSCFTTEHYELHVYASESNSNNSDHESKGEFHYTPNRISSQGKSCKLSKSYLNPQLQLSSVKTQVVTNLRNISQW